MTTATKTIDILIVDDSELVRTGLRTLLGAHGKTTDAVLRVAGEAPSANSAVSESARLKPDVVLMDIRLPDGSGLEACRRILANDPEMKVLILTSVIDDSLVYDAMSSGAHGYLLKEINAQGLRQAIVDVAAGKFILDPTVTTHVLNLVRSGSNPPNDGDKLSGLSAQERRVLALVAEGKTNKEIAEQMGLSDKTVKKLSQQYLRETENQPALAGRRALHEQPDRSQMTVGRTRPDPFRSRTDLPALPALRRCAGFTLVELMIGATLSMFVLAGVLSTFLFIGRSGANVQNYNEMEAQTRQALEIFSEDTRQAGALSWTSNAAVSLSGSGLAVTYSYDSAAKTFSRFDGATTRVLLTGISSFEFKAYSVNGAVLPLASSGDLVSASQSTKQLQISIVLARNNTTVVGATNNVLSARFILRNKRVAT